MLQAGLKAREAIGLKNHCCPGILRFNPIAQGQAIHFAGGV